MRQDTLNLILSQVARYPGEYANPQIFTIWLRSMSAPLVGRLEWSDGWMIVQSAKQTTFFDCEEVAAISLSRSSAEIAREAAMGRI